MSKSVNIDLDSDQSRSESFDNSESLSSSLLKMKLPVDMQLSSAGVRELISNFRGNIKSWPTFATKASFAKPLSAKAWYTRVGQNVTYFQSNYVIVKLILLVFCIITSPFLLLVLAAAVGACYIARLKNAERPIVLAGHTLTLNQQYAGIGVLSIPLLFLAGVGSAIMWVMMASMMVVGSHASFYAVEQIVGDEEAPFDGVTIDEV